MKIKMPSMFNGSLMTSFIYCLLIATCLSVHGQQSNIFIDSYRDGINRINSYNVTYKLEYLQQDLSSKTNSSNGLFVALAQTNQDMFASGLGWRVENQVGDKESHTIAITDWKTLTDSIKSQSVLSPGFTYNNFLNPIIKGMYLTDILRNKQSIISPLSSDDGLGVFRVSNPLLTGFSYIDIVLDSNHDYRLKKYILYVTNKKNGQVVMAEKTEIQEFFQDKNESFPGVISRTIGQGVTGQRFTVDRENSSFNLSVAGNLFLAESLPAVNVEKDGWKYYYPPALLPSVKATIAAMPTPPSKAFKSWVIVLFLGFNALFLIAFIVTRIRKIKIHKTTTI